MSDWTDAIVGDRMTVDREFNERVRSSRFSNQEWGLIMTAVEFEIENPRDAETARIVADTSKLPSVMPELENIREGMGSMAGGRQGGSSRGGFLDSIRDALGMGGTDGLDEAELEAAEDLTQEYADALQEHLQAQGKWEQVRIAYQE